MLYFEWAALVERGQHWQNLAMRWVFGVQAQRYPEPPLGLPHHHQLPPFLRGIMTSVFVKFSTNHGDPNHFASSRSLPERGFIFMSGSIPINFSEELRQIAFVTKVAVLFNAVCQCLFRASKWPMLFLPPLNRCLLKLKKATQTMRAYLNKWLQQMHCCLSKPEMRLASLVLLD